tara:strand:- start:14479 stop:15252 length:774 start_codon:yes stop_codon:yes gene_type:complete
MTAAQKMMMVAPAAGGAFNPETDIAWHSLFWAEGTDFKALGLADGASVATWPNETGESDATQATEAYKPFYNDADSVLNNLPSVEVKEPGSSTPSWMKTAAFSTAPSYTGGVSFVAIAYKVGTAPDRQGMSGGLDNNNTNTVFARYGTSVRIWAGGAARAGSTSMGNNVAHLVVAKFTGSTGNDTMALDGLSPTIDADSGPDQIDGLMLFAHPGNPTNEHLVGGIAFLGVFEGDITQDASYGDFKTWVGSHYGLTIA